ncbi:hypothetical protein BIV57_12470 [Mangrovactinospora gilvigrisea]|uniref:Uncharacterized protein n=1 Tax=Mangrovactinospora gilvigrisea TaxID=1428644 RepID=A0A1J7CBU9_9ACTN|nr:hypothetical protein [Mangrovactinospora gilvigrisea]OIV37138.1 hypothetical protein BIV57_12470 [Mangrovactinospora gilvigrisea]
MIRIRTLGAGAVAAAALTGVAAGTAAADAPQAPLAPQAQAPAQVDPKLATVYREMSGDGNTVTGDGRMVGNMPLSLSELGTVQDRVTRGAAVIGALAQQGMPQG